MIYMVKAILQGQLLKMGISFVKMNMGCNIIKSDWLI